MREEIENTSPVDPLLTVDELAGRLQVKPSWVYGHADELGGYRLGKYLRFSWARVIKRLEHVAMGNPLGSAAQRPFVNAFGGAGCDVPRNK